MNHLIKITLFLFLHHPLLASYHLENTLDLLHNHVSGKSLLSAQELRALEDDITQKAEDLQQKTITQSFEIIALYEKTLGPLFVSPKGPFNREQYQGIELDRVMFALQQGILDYAYSAKQVAKDPQLYKVKFGTSEYFPGSCEKSQEPTKTLVCKINASQREGYGYPTMNDVKVTRRPTGWYLPPGEIGVIAVPSSLVNNGYQIRVGAHSWDLSKKPKVHRLDRVSLVYPIKTKKVTIAHPLGGGIYIELPPDAKSGIQNIHAKNVVEAPFFSHRSFDLMSSDDCRKERSLNAPWVDFETERFMMQIPTEWLKQLKDPIKLMEEYDKCMDLYSELVGRPSLRANSVLYHQVDVTMRGMAFFPGYPQSNFNWNPKAPAIKPMQKWIIESPQKAGHVLFHEMGHAERITKFTGGTEAVVNFPYVYVHNVGYNVDLNEAFGLSFGNKNMSIDEAAISRMITENFREGRPANITNKPGDEVKYQHRGYAIYADIVDLFGWEPIKSFWATDQKNFIAGKDFNFVKGRSFPANINKDPNDSRILRLSIAAGIDLTPLAQFWGRYPDDQEALKKAMRKHNLEPSHKIYDKLQHYKTIIPMNPEEFMRHAKAAYPRVGKPARNSNENNPLYGQGWYDKWSQIYSLEHGEKAQKALQNLIDFYFPNGRPS